MYTQQQQPPLEAQTHLSANAMQQVVDDVSGPLYHQRQVYLPPPSDDSSNNSHDGYAHHYQQPPLPAEPTPSSTDIPTAPPTILQLAEFVSTMIHLLWHVRRSSVLALHSASSHGDFTTLSVNQGDAASALKGSDTAFQRFCQQILTATQLSESVVMLSLKYIAKLLQTSPNIQGAQGSEYRLFVVALLLANKFHDDNTFTNKTWADVSGMKLHELDIMELEFLGVLDFKLFIRKEEFDNWKTGLLTFMAQLQNATLMQEQQNQQRVLDATLRSMGLFIPTPDPTWNSPTNNILTQQQQYLYLLSTAQPEFRAPQPSNAPLPRVPLRVPSYPVYMPPPPPSSSATPSLSSSASTTSTAATTAPLPPSLTPMHAMYHPPPPSQLYQQNYTDNTHHMPPTAEKRSSFHSQPASSSSTAAEPPPLTYPAPARTSNRTIPRNLSTSSLASLAQSNNNNNPYYSHKNENTNIDNKHMTAKSNMGGTTTTNQHQRTYRPYQRPTMMPSDSESQQQQQPLVDYYAWKSLTERKGGASQQSRLRSQSTPSYYRQQQQQQQQQQLSKSCAFQQHRQQSLAPDVDSNQDHQQIGSTDPTFIQHDPYYRQSQSRQQQHQ